MLDKDRVYSARPVTRIRLRRDLAGICAVLTVQKTEEHLTKEEASVFVCVIYTCRFSHIKILEVDYAKQ